ncbi:MAG TPA: hypothetical protein VFH50_05475 [Acidimicrobiales bacterium]|nr:hypothetical protein [Acidimicrobiales bacterium]
MAGGKEPGARRLPGLRESAVMGLALVLLLLRGTGGGTAASLSGQDGNAANTWATFSVAPPGTISPTQSGSNVDVSWGASSNASSYLVQGSSAGKTASCASVTWGTLAAANATTSYTDTGRVTTSQGNYYCYQVTSNDPSGWTSVNNPSTAFSVGLWITSWSWTNAVPSLSGDCTGTYGTNWGKTNTLDCGDTITVAFSAAVDQTLFTASNSAVCVFSAGSGTILLGDTHASGSTSCGTTSDAHTLGQITGNGTLSKNAKFPLYAVSWSGNQVTLTLGIPNTASAEKIGTTWTLTPSTSLAAPSGGQGQVGCTVASCTATYAANS